MVWLIPWAGATFLTRSAGQNFDSGFSVRFNLQIPVGAGSTSRFRPVQPPYSCPRLCPFRVGPVVWLIPWAGATLLTRSAGQNFDSGFSGRFNLQIPVGAGSTSRFRAGSTSGFLSSVLPVSRRAGCLADSLGRCPNFAASHPAAVWPESRS